MDKHTSTGIGYIHPNEPNRDFDPGYRHRHAHADGHCADCNFDGHTHPEQRPDKKEG